MTTEVTNTIWKDAEAKWAEVALDAQMASNAGALLNSASKCLAEWRQGGGDWGGRECIPYRFILHQIGHLTGGGLYQFGDYVADDRALRALCDYDA